MGFTENFKKYAELAVKVGVAVKEGQTVIIRSSVLAIDLTREVTKECYKAGAKDVLVDYIDDEMAHQRLLNAPMEVVEDFPKWKIDGLMTYIREGACIINIVSTNPDLLSDVDPMKLAASNKAAARGLKEYEEYILGGKNCLTLIVYPNLDWAKKVFPGLSDKVALEKLWDNIFKATRIDQEDPIKAWDEHIEVLNKRMNFLNENKFIKVHLTAPGTDLEVELPKGHIWVGGGYTTLDGVYFLPNIPTEEVFSLPKKTGVNGTLRSTKPLNYKSNLIDNFELTFKDGRIVDYSAEVGYDTLKNLIETDEGSHYLGEIALVPHNSPISNANIIFYNTLFDENASCHFAIGSAYFTCMENGLTMTMEEKEKLGVNNSLIHVDFMVGCAEMNIVGIKDDGTEIQVFKDGNWTF